MGVTAFFRRGAASSIGARAFALTLLLSAAASAQGVLNVPEAGLSLKLPALQKVAMVPSSDPMELRELAGHFGEKRVDLTIWLIPDAGNGYAEPSELVDAREKQFAERAAGHPFTFTVHEELTGSYGALPYAQYASGERTKGSDPGGATTFAMVAFITEKGAASVEVVVDPAASAEELQSIRDSLTKGVTVAGKPRDPRWSDEEVRRRWEHDVPPKVQKDPLKPAERTAHYIILSNSGSGALFGKKMEENFAKIQATYPVPERKGRRLMPVFLFRSREQYDRFCDAMKSGAGGTTKGHAWKDYYATWYESLNDPVHLHEATRQIFANRLGLCGGGSWFQEGLAEYVCTKRDERNAIAQRVAKGKAIPLKNLIGDEASATGRDAEERCTESALVIEFLRDSPGTKAKFADFVQQVGQASPRSRSEIEKALHASLGLSIEELDLEFTRYCVKR